MQINKLIMIILKGIILLGVLLVNTNESKSRPFDLEGASYTYNYEELINNSSGSFCQRNDSLFIKIILRNSDYNTIYLPVSTWCYISDYLEKYTIYDSGEMYLRNMLFAKIEKIKFFKSLADYDLWDLKRHLYIYPIQDNDSLTITIKLKIDSSQYFTKKDSIIWIFSCIDDEFSRKLAKLSNINFDKLLHTFDTTNNININIINDNKRNVYYFDKEYPKNLKKKESDFLRFIFKKRYRLILRYNENI